MASSRLILRPFESGDVEVAFTWFADPIVMRFAPTGPDASIKQTKARLTNYQEHQTAHGFSKWIILDRRLGRAIGDSGLLELQEYGRIDLGFRLAQPYCPLTALETWFEVRGNVPAYRGPFLLHYLDAMVYPDISPNLLIAGAVAVCILNLWIYIRRFRIRHSLG